MPYQFDPAPDPNCSLCNGNALVITPKNELAHAQVCSCIGECLRCGGSGVVVVDEGGVKRAGRCRCQKLPDRVKIFNAAKIPAIHGGNDFVNFLASSRASTQSKIMCTKWSSAFGTDQETKGLVLTGNVGRGKTHLLIGIIKNLIFEHGKRIRFIEFSRLLSELRAAYSKGNSDSAILNELATVPILAIDEIGKGRLTDWEQSIIDEVVSRRYNGLRPIIGTTNFPWAESTGREHSNLARSDFELQTLGDRVGNRAFSRLQQICYYYEVRGDDYRAMRPQKLEFM